MPVDPTMAGGQLTGQSNRIDPTRVTAPREEPPAPIDRPVILNATPRLLRQYKDDYQRGWKARGPRALRYADRRRERSAWYDGYADFSDGLEKWHRLYCPDHDACALGYTEDHEFREYNQQQTAELIRHMRWQHGLGPMTAAEMKQAYKDASTLRANHKASRSHAGTPA